MLVERPGVCVLASTVDDWLLWRVAGFALYSLERRGGWPLIPAVPLPGYCFDGILCARYKYNHN